MNQSRTTSNTEDDGETSAGVEAVQDQTQTVSYSVDRNIHDDRGYQETHMRSPGAKSWYSKDEELSPRASKFYSHLYTTDGYEQSTDCDPAYVKPSTLRTAESRKASTITVFPTFTNSFKKPDPDSERVDADVEQREPMVVENGRAKSQSYIKRLKEIYRAGPPGEGQMLWRGLRDYWRERQAGVVFEMCSPYRTEEASHVPSPELVLDREAADSPQRQSPTSIHGAGEDAEQRRSQHDSVVSYGDISRTSREVPIKIRRTVLMLDMDKPLPSPPRLSDAPKRRSQRAQGKVLDLNKPLPRTPFPSFPEPPKAREASEESPVAPPWRSTHAATVGSEISDRHDKPSKQDSSTSHGQSKHIAQDPQPTTWLKSLVTKAPNAQPNPAGKSKPSKADKAHDALKAKISRPIPISPAAVAADFSPHRLPPDPDATSEKAKGKQKAPSSPAWLNKLAHPALPTMPTMLQARKRPASDKSFNCQGLGEGHVCGECVTDSELGVHDGGQRMRHGDGMRPEPLFTGGMFDGSYYDVEDANADQTRTGRWI